MATEVLTVTSEEGYWEKVRKAGQVLREGGLLVLPTETVYGLAVSAEDPSAVERLRQVKGRADDTPLTVHIGRRSTALDFVNEVSGSGRRLMARGWPGPLTLVFEVPRLEQVAILNGRDPGLAERIYYDGTVGLRFPDCPPACDAINEAGCVVVASSANRSGSPPPTTVDQALEGIQHAADLALDGGKTRYEGASTIARVTEHLPRILRPGVIDERTVRRWASNTILLVCTGNTCRSPMADGLLKSMLADRLGCAPQDLESHGYNVMSAGTAAVSGAPATPEAVQALAGRQVDISGHRSVPLSAEIVHQAQVILVMTEAHRQAVLQLAPDAAERTHLLGKDHPIEDPIGGAPEVYELCRDQIASCLEARLTEMLL